MEPAPIDGEPLCGDPNHVWPCEACADVEEELREPPDMGAAA